MAGFNGSTDAGNVKRSEIVNNLTSGGTTVPLSAEMGKLLKDTKSPAFNFHAPLYNWRAYNSVQAALTGEINNITSSSDEAVYVVGGIIVGGGIIALMILRRGNYIKALDVTGTKYDSSDGGGTWTVT